MSIFEQASRQKLRFASIKGLLTTEDLWDLPLTSKTGFDLDTLAKQTNASIKAAAEESFVVVTDNPAKKLAELQLEILKHVIGARVAQADATKLAAQKRAERERLVALLGEKQDEALRGLSVDDIKKRIEELGS